MAELGLSGCVSLIAMKNTLMALLASLGLSAGVAFADQASVQSSSDVSVANKALDPSSFGEAAAVAATPASTASAITTPPGETIVRMDTLRVSGTHYPSFSNLASASFAPGLLEPCALVKVDVKAKRRYDFFLAPVALSNGAAGFGLTRLSW